jgi:ABC-type sugar transport system substrate-binding protein
MLRAASVTTIGGKATFEINNPLAKPTAADTARPPTMASVTLPQIAVLENAAGAKPSAIVISPTVAEALGDPIAAVTANT